MHITSRHVYNLVPRGACMTEYGKIWQTSHVFYNVNTHLSFHIVICHFAASLVDVLTSIIRYSLYTALPCQHLFIGIHALVGASSERLVAASIDDFGI